jgi:hypothetical protein
MGLFQLRQFLDKMVLNLQVAWNVGIERLETFQGGLSTMK